MGDTNEPKLVLPFLKPFYDVVIPLSWPLVRCSVGLILAVHGWPKFLRVIELMGGDPLTRGSVSGLLSTHLPWVAWTHQKHLARLKPGC